MDPSIVNYLSSIGQPTDYASRAKLAASKGISGYTGSAQQNTQLLQILRGSAPQATVPAAPAKPTTSAPVQQTAAPAAQSMPTAGTSGGVTPEGIPIANLPPELVYNGQLDISNPAKQAQYQQLVGQFKQTSGASGVTGASTSFLNTPTIDLKGLYEGLYNKSGIAGIEAELSSKSKAYTEAVAKIKDNPYLSEATMSGRLKKIDEKFNADTKNIRDDIAMRKADIETKLNLEMKQFDIQSQQAQQAISQFNSLLSSGALDSATGEDIANITRSTGISSSMIQSAIAANKKKNAPKVSISQVDDGTNIYAVAVDENGNVTNKQVLATSKPKSTTGTTSTEQKAIDKKQTTANLLVDIKAGVTPRDLVPHYSDGLSVDEIYRLYNIYSPYGIAKEKGGVKDWKAGKFIS